MLDKVWGDIEPLLAKPESIKSISDFNQRVDVFCSAYRKHVTKENECFLPVIHNMLSEEQLETLSNNMQERRLTGVYSK